MEGNRPIPTPNIELQVAWWHSLMPGPEAAAGLVTILGMLGAVAGALAFRSIVRSTKAVPVSAGMLLGMATFVILPAALAGNSLLILLGSISGGSLVFFVLERCLHRSSDRVALVRDPHVLLAPLFVAASIHALVDGWNVAMIRYLPGSHFGASLVMAMGLHKMCEGVALGAIFRSVVNSTRQALYGALLCEGLTFAGAMLASTLNHRLGHQWTGGLPGATAGSFLYLGCHAMNTAWKRDCIRATLTPCIGWGVYRLGDLVVLRGS